MITLPLPAVDAARSGWLFYCNRCCCEAMPAHHGLSNQSRARIGQGYGVMTVSPVAGPVTGIYIGKDAKTVHASLRCAPVRSLSTALADGGFNYLLVFALSSLSRWCNAGGIFLR